MNRKELTKTFRVISNWKNPLFSMVCTQLFRRSEGYVLACGVACMHGFDLGRG